MKNAIDGISLVAKSLRDVIQENLWDKWIIIMDIY